MNASDYAGIDFSGLDGVDVWLDLDSDTSDAASGNERNVALSSGGTLYASLIGLETAMSQDGSVDFTFTDGDDTVTVVGDWGSGFVSISSGLGNDYYDFSGATGFIGFWYFGIA